MYSFYSAIWLGSECERMTEHDLNKLLTFHMGHLRRTLRIFSNQQPLFCYCHYEKDWRRHPRRKGRDPMNCSSLDTRMKTQRANSGERNQSLEAHLVNYTGKVGPEKKKKNGCSLLLPYMQVYMKGSEWINGLHKELTWWTERHHRQLYLAKCSKNGSMNAPIAKFNTQLFTESNTIWENGFLHCITAI